MAKKAENRYQTPAEAASALAPFCKAASVSSAQVLRVTPPKKEVATDTDPPSTDNTVSPDESVDVELISLNLPATTPGKGRAAASTASPRPQHGPAAD